MGAQRNIAAGARGRALGVDAPGRPHARDHRRQVCRAVSFHRLLLGHLGQNQSRVAGARLGPSKIYDPGLPVDAYPPGSVYLLWLSGWIGGLIEPSANGFRVIVETPPLIADLLYRPDDLLRGVAQRPRHARTHYNDAVRAEPGAHFRHRRVGSERFGRRAADDRRRDPDSHRPLSPRMECGRDRDPGQAASARVHAAAGTVDAVQRGHRRDACGVGAQSPARS